MKRFKQQPQGFALVELLIAMAISGLLISAIYSVFIMQSKTFSSQAQIIELQQELRRGIALIEEDLRNTGYNPGGLTKARAETDGVDNDCDGSVDETDNHVTSRVDESEAFGFKIAESDTISFNSDLNGDGQSCSANESITYTLDGTSLLKNGVSILENVDALDFVYLDEENVVTTDVDKIHSVEIAIVGRTAKADPDYVHQQSYANLQGDEILSAQNDGYHRWLLTSHVYCRNLKH